jgi:hypothetical protein
MSSANALIRNVCKGHIRKHILEDGHILICDHRLIPLLGAKSAVNILKAMGSSYNPKS